jgi:hypothetical protein
MLVSTLKRTVKNVTNQKNYLNWLQEKSFKLSSVSYSIENEAHRIDFNKFNETMYSLSVFEKESKKLVSLYFNDNSLSVVNIFRRKIFFLSKKSSLSYVVKEENYDNDVNIRFVWKVIPEYLINLR